VSDVRDPAFYSTCYVRATPNVRFEGIAPPTAPPTTPRWHFGDHCVTCDDVARNAYGYVVPQWSVLSNNNNNDDDECVDCTRQPSVVAPPPLNVLGAQWTELKANGYCDGFNWQEQHQPTVSACCIFVCSALKTNNDIDAGFVRRLARCVATHVRRQQQSMLQGSGA
jgi:hypothetical protein